MLRAFVDKLGRKPPFPPVAPDTPFCAIGDIHGCADLLSDALRQAKDRPVVCVGDYVDRGARSADVLQMLFARPDIICLSGNHEEMMLRFIDTPEEYGSRWLRYGGVQTLASFDVGGVDAASDAGKMRKARDELVAAIDPALLDWVRDLPSMWTSGNVAVVHAGADPGVPMDDQTSGVLRWGHPDFDSRVRQDGIWVLHGHTIVDAPQMAQGRIAIDTGAYATGRLTMAHVETGSVTFETLS